MYKSVEVPAEVFAGMLKALREKGVSEDPEHAGKFLKSISKANSFDMTLMFMDSKEKTDLKEILRELKNATTPLDLGLLKELDKIYNL